MKRVNIFQKSSFFASVKMALFAGLFAMVCSNDVLAQGTIIDNGSTNNKWIFHNPNDSRKMLFLAPRNSSNSNWDWSKQTVFDDNGDVFFSGRIGVGSNNVGGNLNLRVLINGNLGCGSLYASYIFGSSVRVTSPDGADFVFEEDYNLPSLADVESYINVHNHLPEISSADEMKANGLELSSFTIKLLQKIEELTLYTIEQEKRIEAQERRIQILEDKDSISQPSVQE